MSEKKIEVKGWVTKAGAVTLPRAVRYSAGMKPGTPVLIRAGREEITISKLQPSCFNCGEIQDLKEFAGITICRWCAEKLRRSFDEK